MANRHLDIRLRSTYDGSGVSKASADISSMTKAINVLSKGASDGLKNLAGLLKGIATGGIWEIGAAAVRGVGAALVAWWKEAEEVSKKSTEVTVRGLESQTAALNAYKVTIDDVAKTERAAIEATAKARQNEIAATERLAKATIELARQKRIAAGEDAATVNAETDAASRAASQTAARGSLDAKVKAIKAKIAQAEGGAFAAEEELKELRFVLDETPNDYNFASPEAQKKARENRRAIRAKIADAKKALEAAQKNAEAGRAELALASSERDAMEAEFAAAEQKAANDKVAADRRAAEERAKAEVDAAKKAAAERERLDREAHQKRMADLRAEIAAQKEAANPLRARAAAAQTEFERAFALYRDPSRAAAQRDEEEAYRKDLNRLHKDARRYGGKWRVDELSALMAAGDSQGVSDTLAGWRKSRSFTPEVEAMVRASAAERTKTTTEDELRKIENNTAGLASKLDELLAMKGGA